MRARVGGVQGLGRWQEGDFSDPRPVARRAQYLSCATRHEVTRGQAREEGGEGGRADVEAVLTTR